MEINKKKILWALAAAVILMIVAVCALMALKMLDYKLEAKQFVRSEYQAVFLSNGQVYFGKLHNSGYQYKLTDVYYLQVTED